jgi:hypothetical protein
MVGAFVLELNLGALLRFVLAYAGSLRLVSKIISIRMCELIDSLVRPTWTVFGCFVRPPTSLLAKLRAESNIYFDSSPGAARARLAAGTTHCAPH